MLLWLESAQDYLAHRVLRGQQSMGLHQMLRIDGTQMLRERGRHRYSIPVFSR